MAELSLGVPGLLRDCVGGESRVRLEARTPAEAIQAMIEIYPRLKAHVFDELGEVREHVFLALNGRKLKSEDLEAELRDGDRFDIVQAVSGG